MRQAKYKLQNMLMACLNEYNKLKSTIVKYDLKNEPPIVKNNLIITFNERKTQTTELKYTATINSMKQLFDCHLIGFSHKIASSFLQYTLKGKCNFLNVNVLEDNK